MSPINYRYKNIQVMLQFILIAGAIGLSLPLCARAQTPAKIDIIKALHEIPPPPTSVSDAHARATCNEGGCSATALFKAFDDKMQAAQKQWDVINVAQGRDLDSTKRLVEVLKATQGKSPKEQIEAAKNIPGVSTKAISLAELMQDPEFQKKIAAMSEEERMAYIQNILMPPSTSAITQDPGLSRTMQEFQQRMIHDPAFAAAWKKKSPAEQDAYFHTEASKNGFDPKALGARLRQQAADAAPKDTAVSSKPKSTSHALLTFDDDDAPKSGASSTATALKQQSDDAMRGLLTFKISTERAAGRVDSILMATPARLEAALSKHRQEIKAKAARMGVAVIHDPPGEHAIRLQSVTNEIAEVNADLTGLTKAFASDKGQLEHICASFNTSLMQARYGETLTTVEDQKMITYLAQTQIRAMSYINQMETAVKGIYPNVAYLEIQKATIEKETFGKYEELMVKGEGDD